MLSVTGEALGHIGEVINCSYAEPRIFCTPKHVHNVHFGQALSGVPKSACFLS